MKFGESIVGLGSFGAFIYGVANRLLIPTGLHHALNSVFWFDTIGINDIGKFQSGKDAVKVLLDVIKQVSFNNDVWYSCSSLSNVSYS